MQAGLGEDPGGAQGADPEPPGPQPPGPQPPGPPQAPRRPVGDDAGYGRLGVLLVAVFIGLPLLGLLLAWYISLTGELPFSIRPGPYGIPPWGPFLLLLGAIGIACFVPILTRNVGQRDRTFWDQVATNKRNSVFLSVAVVGSVGLTAYVLGTVLTLSTTGGLIVGLVTVLAGTVGAVFSYRSGDRVILAVSGAKPVADGEEPVLHDVVRELSVAANIPPPRLFLIDDSAPNAFAAGRDPGHAVLAVTRGLLTAMDREELQGVVAHEVAHIRNYDSRYNLFVAVLAGTAVLIADGFFQVVTFPFRLPWSIFRAISDGSRAGGSGGYDQGSRRVTGSGSGGGWSFPDIDLGDGGGDSKGAGSILLVILAVIIFIVLVLIVSAIVYAIAPVFARLMQASVSREREYLADASAVELGRNPAALERALAKVASTEEVLEVANRATAPLYFVNPIRAFEKRASSIYSTHPSTADRIDRLRVLQGRPPLTRSESAAFVEDDD